MIVIPAIDIRGGRCVRLKQGKFTEETEYFDDPVSVAEMWESKGAKYLHVVDLDGALNGGDVNFNLIKSIVRKTSLPIEVGGGIRTLTTVKKYADIGVDRVILGTKAVESPEFVEKACSLYPDKIAVSVDSKCDFIAVKGWTENSSLEVVPFCNNLEILGVSTIIYTDISRDGMMVGPNLQMLNKLKSSLRANIIASGGVGTIDHIRELAKLNLYGAITGKALYEGRITIEDIVE